jgi:hypothetical protein
MKIKKSSWYNLNLNPVIKKIEFTSAEVEEIDKINKGIAVPTTRTVTTKSGSKYDVTWNRKFTYSLARVRLRQLYGGLCTSCGSWPEYKILYDRSSKDQGAKLVERYCQPCFSKWEDRIKRK